MARKIIWTEQAIDERKAILEFWYQRTKSKTYPKKLFKKFNQHIELVAVYPLLGRSTQVENVRIKFMDTFYIIYSYSNSAIFIHSVWDNRQDPSKQPIQKK